MCGNRTDESIQTLKNLSSAWHQREHEMEAKSTEMDQHMYRRECEIEAKSTEMDQHMHQCEREMKVKTTEMEQLMWQEVAKLTVCIAQWLDSTSNIYVSRQNEKASLPL